MNLGVNPYIDWNQNPIYIYIYIYKNHDHQMQQFNFKRKIKFEYMIINGHNRIDIKHML